MNRLKLMILILVLLTTITSCSYEKKNKTLVSQETNQISKTPIEVEFNEIIYNKLDKVFNADEVEAYYTTQKNRAEYFEKFEIDYYKTYESSEYTIIKTDEGYYMVSFYNGEVVLLTKIAFSDPEIETAISTLEEGTSITDVMDLDPMGNFDFFRYFSGTTYPPISLHFFENGNCYIAQYEDQGVDEENGLVSIVHITI